MRTRLEDCAIALGVVTVCLMFLLGPVISPDHNFLYHLSAPASVGIIPVMVNFLAAWIILFGILRLAQRRPRLDRLVWLFLILLLPGIFLKNCAELTGWPVPHGLTLAAFLLPVVLFAIAIFGLRVPKQPAFAKTQRAYAALLAFVGIAGAAILAQVLWTAWQARALNAARPLRSESAPVIHSANHPRIVWIILDELSYQQVYESRYPQLQLPAFDSLAAQASVFTRVTPAGAHTEVAVNALLSGVATDRIRVSASGQLLSLHNPETNAWTRFDPGDNAFHDAVARGERTGVAGWFNPYCRVMPRVLDRCFWTYRASFGAGIDSDRSVFENIAAPVRRLLSYSLFSYRRMVSSSRPASPMAVRDGEMHIADYQDLDAASLQLLRESSLDFVFLHVPVPHPQGIFDRQTMTFSIDHTSYIDNLVLADRYLAEVRDVLESQGQWDSSLVLVMGDHSWRTQYFRKEPEWSREDGLASHGGQFDDRPGYIVKLPGQQAGAHIDAPFAALRTRSLIAAVAGNQIRTAADLEHWVQSPPGGGQSR